MKSLPLLALLLGLAPACGEAAPAVDGPNVLWIVWDTVRADRLSLYGHERPTTPFLEGWAADALVFDDARSTASSTAPSHAAMFTGLLPTENGTNNRYRFLDEGHTTLAELLQSAGWHTWVWAANPHISSDHHFTQGFEREEHPWDDTWKERAYEILKGKLRDDDTSSELPDKLRSGKLRDWGLHATGALAADALDAWLDELGQLPEPDGARPWFAFVNYMEAHRPFLSPATNRLRVMDDEAMVARSYAIDRSWDTMWSYNFGLHEYDAEELEVMARTYEAGITELDDFLRDLIGRLEARGVLEDTIIVLTADHGEHLGEHHLLDHQYSLYEGLVHVPLVIRAPGRVAPGRETRPVSTIDIFPTLLELCDVAYRGRMSPGVHSLLDPDPERERLAEYPSVFPGPIKRIKQLHPEWDPKPFERDLRALWRGPYKLIWAADGRNELYDMRRGETLDLYASEPELAAELEAELEAHVAELVPFVGDGAPVPAPRGRQRARMEDLGYAGD